MNTQNTKKRSQKKIFRNSIGKTLTCRYCEISRIQNLLKKANISIVSEKEILNVSSRFFPTSFTTMHLLKIDKKKVKAMECNAFLTILKKVLQRIRLVLSENFLSVKTTKIFFCFVKAFRNIQGN